MSLDEKTVEHHLFIHCLHTVGDFLAANRGREFRDDAEVYEAFVAFEVEHWEKSKLRREKT